MMQFTRRDLNGKIKVVYIDMSKLIGFEGVQTEDGPTILHFNNEYYVEVRENLYTVLKKYAESRVQVEMEYTLR